MSYESGTNGLGVGQRYGERDLGNVCGVTTSTSGESRKVFEFDGTEPLALAAATFSIPEGNAVITKIYVEVAEAFASGTVDVDVDGTPVNTAPQDLNVEGMFEAAQVAAVAIDETNVVSVSFPAAAVAVAAGSYAKVVVEFTRV